MAEVPEEAPAGMRRAWGLPVRGFAYYHSGERMSVRGAMAAGGTTLRVSGSAWLDSPRGDLGGTGSLGWELSLRPDDCCAILLFTVRPKDDESPKCPP